MSSVITEDQLPDDVTSAESFLARHQEHKAEIETRQRSVNDFCDAADKLVADGHSASADVIDKKRRLSTAWQALQSTWSEKGLDLEHSKEVQMFKRDADQLEAWLNARELDQESNDVGDSLDAVEELLKKHDEFEKMLLAQEMKLLGITKLTNQEEELSKQKKDAENKEEARRREEELRRKQEEERQEMEQRRKKEEEDERQARKEQELRERKRLEQIQLNEEKEKKEKERKELNEREKLKALEERKRTEEMAKREEERKREEIVKVKQEEQRPHEWNYNDNAQGKKKASNSVTIEGILQRKQELTSGGRKVHARAWKTLYTVLRGNELSFYREKKDSRGTNYAAPTLALTDGFCEEASDAVRRKNAFRLLCDDDSEFFFVAKDSEDLNRWITNINEASGQVDLPSPPPPPQESPAALPLPEHQRSIGSPEKTKPYERTPSPSITITSFDDDEDILVDPPPPPLVTAQPYPAPVEFPQESMLTETENGDLNEILADIGSIPLEPDSLPPAFPPPDFADFHDSLDGEDIPVLPASPPPDLNSDDEDSLDNSVEDSPLANILSELQRPTPPLRTKKKTSPSPVASTPESHRTYNSGGFSKPLIKPKPANLANQRSALSRQTPDLPLTLKSADGTSESAHDLKKQDKRKGVLGNIFKKKK